VGTRKQAGTGQQPDSHAGTGPVVSDDALVSDDADVSDDPVASNEKESLEREIVRTREQLGETVERLAAKADVKAMAARKATELSERVKDTTGQLRGQVRDRRIPLAVAAGVLLVGYLVVRQWRAAARRHHGDH
jgi:Protein of unknown function (DUF3618)